MSFLRGGPYSIRDSTFVALIEIPEQIEGYESNIWQIVTTWIGDNLQLLDGFAHNPQSLSIAIGHLQFVLPSCVVDALFFIVQTQPMAHSQSKTLYELCVDHKTLMQSLHVR